ncbi:Pycsar system effector family protein [Glycomyces sp. NPDC047010]|uniref:Pycsar system effector family protein n=1 Tax=Glycomyces sp. NPDC047010 TaxID=3155023 RepID=UPI0033E070B4
MEVQPSIVEDTMSRALSPHPDAAIEEVRCELDHSRQMIGHADAKASFLAAGAIPIAAILLAAPALADPSTPIRVVSWTASFLLIIGIGCLGSVVWPRLPSRDVGIRAGAHHSPEEIAARAIALTRDRTTQLTSCSKEQAVLSTLALTKFRLLRVAMSCFGAAALLMLVAAAVFTF